MIPLNVNPTIVLASITPKDNVNKQEKTYNATQTHIIISSFDDDYTKELQYSFHCKEMNYYTINHTNNNKYFSFFNFLQIAAAIPLIVILFGDLEYSSYICRILCLELLS